MSESKQTADLLKGLLIGDPMSEHHGVQCCPAIREDTDDRYIVKILSIPASQVQLDALLLTGAYSTPKDAMEYFHQLAQEAVDEAELLDRLSKLEGFLAFEGTAIRKIQNRTGYEVHLLSPYRRSLERQMQLEPLTHLAAVNLGLDLCAALAICRRAGYLYVDLKPGNVYITPSQGCRIGDLGFMALGTLKYASLPEKYHSPYTAPEIQDAMSSLNDTLDIYALGLVLYQVYNNGQLPFEGKAPGTPLPPPTYADYEMAEIILKACHPDPAQRWKNPVEMGQALAAYMQRNSINDTPIVPAPVSAPPQPEPEPEPEPAEEDPFISEEENEADLGSLLQSILDSNPPAEQAPIGNVDAFLEQNAEYGDIDIPLDDDFSDAEDVPLDGEDELTDESDGLTDTEDDELRDDVVSDDDTSDTIFDEDFSEDYDPDETLPSEDSIEDLDDAAVTSEVEEMLAQADELLAHELPEPAVAPDPIDVPFPAPITIDDTTADLSDTQVVASFDEPSFDEEAQEDYEDYDQDADDEESYDEYEDEEVDADDEYEDEEAYSEDEDYEDEEEYEEEDDDDDEEETSSEYIRIRRPRKRKTKALVSLACCLALLVALCVGGFLFYRYYYLQPVNEMTIEGSVDSLTVQINAPIRDELLRVICTDTYGNTREAEVLNGRAHLSNLTPNTQYRVKLTISGFHKLTGNTSGSYTTSAQTEILNFNAVAGSEDGSVILSFTVNGPETEEWTIGYSTGNQQEITQTFTGHTVTITGLSVGSDYLFRLIPSEDQFLTGNWQLNYTTQQVVFAQQLTIRSCADGVLNAEWSIPAGLEGTEWTVRCFNDQGFDKTITTKEAQAQFVELDHAHGYTVEVTAAGMTQTASASVTANPITMKDIAANPQGRNLNLTWSFSGTAPAEGWILDYSINGGEVITLSCKDAKAQLPLYPGCQYDVDIHPVGEQTFYKKAFHYDVEKAATFEKYGVTPSDMSFYICHSPAKENWDRFDLKPEDYGRDFKQGQKASMLIKLEKEFEDAEDHISITFITYDANGNPLSSESTEMVWNKMWDQERYCKLDLPKLPEAAGKYKVEIYFSNQFITGQIINIT